MAQLQPTHLTTTDRKLSAAPFSSGSATSPVGNRNGIVARQIEVSKCWRDQRGRRRVVTAAGVSSADEATLGTTLLMFEDQTELNVEVEVEVEVEDEEAGVEECFVQEYGWKVRRMVEGGSEMRKVAQIQAEAFHVPVALFNEFFFFFFQAEVLSALLYRLRNSPPDRYACLVAEPANTSTSKEEEELVGVADVTVLRDSDVLQHLDGARQYLYVSGIAVSKQHRRKKVATALLKACEAVSMLWGYEYLVLRAYDDDRSARALYTKAGYRVVAKDPPWLAWVGRKRRILMIKRASASSSIDIS